MESSVPSVPLFTLQFLVGTGYRWVNFVAIGGIKVPNDPNSNNHKILQVKQMEILRLTVQCIIYYISPSRNGDTSLVGFSLPCQNVSLITFFRFDLLHVPAAGILVIATRFIVTR